MFKIRFNLRAVNLTSFMLSLLIISINLREPFFHSREILFALLIIISIHVLDISNMKDTFTLMSIWLVSVVFNLVFPGSSIDFRNGGFETIIVSVYLLLMCYCQEGYAKVIIKSYIFVSIIVALIIISIWTTCYLSDSAYLSLKAFFENLRENTGLSLINIDYRGILGHKYLTVWYRTAPCMVCSLGYCLIQRIENKGKNTFKILLLSIALIFSGTRADILSAFALIGFYVIFKMRKCGIKLIPTVIFFAVVIIGLILVMRFISDPGSASSRIKTADASSYLNVYKSDIIRFILFGWGPGSSFYSLGRDMFVNVTELSLFETIRRYGLISTGIILFGIWFRPLRILNFWKMNYIKWFYVLIFLIYFLSAFSNPYFLDSVAFCALLFYSTWFMDDMNNSESTYVGEDVFR